MNERNLNPDLFDMVVFIYDDSNQEEYPYTGKALVLRDVTPETAVDEMSNMEMFKGWTINGAIQLARVQTHFRDIHVLQPQAFLVSIEAGYIFLHDLPVWDKENKDIIGKWALPGTQNTAASAEHDLHRLDDNGGKHHD